MSTASTPTAIGKYLDFILAIAGEKELPATDLARILGTTTRNVYYLLADLRDYGFTVNHNHRLYSLDASSPFFQRIARSVDFTHDQAAYLYNVLAGVEKDNALAGMLRRKLQRFYHLNEHLDIHFHRQVYKNMSLLQKAIRHKQIVILHDYASSNSQSVSDRIVEPFLFLGDNSDVRCYEIKTGLNKTFKVSRIGQVEVLQEVWFNEKLHKEAFTDMFLFSGEERHHVKLRFDILAHNLMKEEYPHSVGAMTETGDGHWLFETDVANYRGIGRFILGLFDHIEVIDDDGLRQYLQEHIERMKDSLSREDATAHSDGRSPQ